MLLWFFKELKEEKTTLIVNSMCDVRMNSSYPKNIEIPENQNQTFHYTRRFTLKCVTSLRCPSSRHSAKVIQLLA